MAPFLRDTLVGFNYMHYAPPGAQVLRTNPLFVRSHDFIGLQGTTSTWRTTPTSCWTAPRPLYAGLASVVEFDARRWDAEQHGDDAVAASQAADSAAVAIDQHDDSLELP